MFLLTWSVKVLFWFSFVHAIVRIFPVIYILWVLRKMNGGRTECFLVFFYTGFKMNKNVCEAVFHLPLLSNCSLNKCKRINNKAFEWWLLANSSTTAVWFRLQQWGGSKLMFKRLYSTHVFKADIFTMFTGCEPKPAARRPEAALHASLFQNKSVTSK